MEKRNIISVTWKVVVDDLIKYNLAKENVRSLVETFILKTTEAYTARGIKIQRKKP